MTEAEAREALDAAVLAYYAEVDPSSVIVGWTVVAQKVTVDDRFPVARVSAPRQLWSLTRGILDIALEADRSEVKSQ